MVESRDAYWVTGSCDARVGRPEIAGRARVYVQVTVRCDDRSFRRIKGEPWNGMASDGNPETSWAVIGETRSAIGLGLSQGELHAAKVRTAS